VSGIAFIRLRHNRRLKSTAFPCQEPALCPLGIHEGQQAQEAPLLAMQLNHSLGKWRCMILAWPLCGFVIGLLPSLLSAMSITDERWPNYPKCPGDGAKALEFSA
jgi:hypothetical protein